MIHPSAIVSPDAQLDETVTVHPFAVIGAAKLGPGVVIHPNVVIADGVWVGENTEVFPGAFIGKEPKGAGATARLPTFTREVRIGVGCSIGPHSVIFYGVTIGDGTLLGDGASIREGCRVGARCILSRYVTVNYDTIIGDRVKVMDGTHLTGGMVIADDVFLAMLIATSNDNTMGRAGYGEHVAGPRIERGVVVGSGAVLLPGIVLGEGATIGANAVVTRSVDPGARVAGIPARPFAAAPDATTR